MLSRITNHEPRTTSLSRLWLLLGTAALGVAGLYSLILVVARTPQFKEMPLFIRLFHEALVVHVDLSVLVWFLAIACMFMSLLAAPAREIIYGMEKAALLCFAFGSLSIAASPLDSKAVALMSNYIPVITSPIFFFGLSLILCGTGLMLARVYTAKKFSVVFDAPLQFGIYSTALIALLSIAGFFWSFKRMPDIIEGQQRYELGFWGGGHILQFAHTQILMVCWLLLARAIIVIPSAAEGSKIPPLPMVGRNDNFIIALFAIGLLAAIASPLGYTLYDITSMEHRDFFTQLMIGGGGIAPTVLTLLLLPKIWRKTPDKKALWSTLIMSIILFGYGGVLGGLIQGQNVVIPAHYHGSIVGITLAFMGAAYLYLPQFGYRDVSRWKLAFWQPIVYGVGQLMHISGLAWSGGYGVLRKTPGGMADLPPDVKAALGFMGAGGLLAIIGGIMFVIVVIRAVRNTR